MNRAAKYRMITLIIAVIAAVSGCMNQQNQEPSETRIQETNFKTEIIDQAVARQAKKHVQQKEPITEAKAVNTEDLLVIAVKVKPFDRFRLPEIQKEIQADLKKMFPNSKIELTADKKIFMKLDDLEQQIKQEKTDAKSVRKQVKTITDLMKEE